MKRRRTSNINCKQFPDVMYHPLQNTMPTVRVSGIPIGTEEKEIKVCFRNPRNGGGKISKIYYPMLGNDAVIVYQPDTGNIVATKKKGFVVLSCTLDFEVLTKCFCNKIDALDSFSI